MSDDMIVAYGVNDGATLTPDEVDEALASTVARIREVAPDAHVVAGRPVPPWT